MQFDAASDLEECTGHLIQQLFPGVFIRIIVVDEDVQIPVLLIDEILKVGKVDGSDTGHSIVDIAIEQFPEDAVGIETG